MDQEPHRASRKSNLKIESENTPEPPYGGAGGVRQPPPSWAAIELRRRHQRRPAPPTAASPARSAPLKLKNETAIWNRRLARARVRRRKWLTRSRMRSKRCWTFRWARGALRRRGGAGGLRQPPRSSAAIELRRRHHRRPAPPTAAAPARSALLNLKNDKVGDEVVNALICVLWMDWSAAYLV